MLLLVVDPQINQFHRFRRKILCEQVDHRLVDIQTIGVNFVETRPRQNVPQGPQRAIANRVVVRIEEAAEGWMIRPEILHVLRQDEGLEKPSGMCQVPLRGTGVRHRLQRVVFHGKRSAQMQRKVAHSQIALQQRSLA